MEMERKETKAGGGGGGRGHQKMTTEWPQGERKT